MNVAHVLFLLAVMIVWVARRASQWEENKVQRFENINQIVVSKGENMSNILLIIGKMSY